MHKPDAGGSGATSFLQNVVVLLLLGGLLYGVACALNLTAHQTENLFAAAWWVLVIGGLIASLANRRRRTRPA